MSASGPHQPPGSFYADPGEGVVRMCRGTSCWLRGGDRARFAIPEQAEVQPVYCVGHCDRSPAVLHVDESVEALGHAVPSVRCRAREAIVTGRIKQAGAAGLDGARAGGVYSALESALRDSPEAVLAELERSGEQGRGGAGFPTGRKWRAAARTAAPDKIVIANGDEGDPGSFVDRWLLEEDPHTVLEGLALCAHAVGAREGVVFIRSEYPRALGVMRHAVADAQQAGMLGESFRVRVVAGRGSYVSGEETALLNAIEGKRGEVRLRPPYPTEHGLEGLPTVVNNVETLANVPWIVRHGADAYRALGTEDSPGTKALSLNAGFTRPGLVEVEFGTSLRSVVEDAGSYDIEAIVLGGPMGSVLDRSEWEVPIAYDALRRRGIVLGHGGIVALPQGTDYAALVEHWLEFMASESCGKCAPCALGSRRALQLARLGGDRQARAGRQELGALLPVIARTSLCGFGQALPRTVEQLLDRIPEVAA